jgi:hypothetical protein
MPIMLLSWELLTLFWKVSLENSELRILLQVVVPIETSIIYNRLKTGESLENRDQVGVILDNSNHIIRANVFKLNVSASPSKVNHYHVSTSRFDRENNIREEDLAKENKYPYCETSYL